MDFDYIAKIPPERGKILFFLANNVDKTSIFISGEDVEKLKRFFFWSDLTKEDLLFYCSYKERKPKKKNKIRDNYLGDYSIYLGLKYCEDYDAYLAFFLRSEPLMRFYMNKNIKNRKVLLELN